MTWQRRAACRASPQLFDLDLDTDEAPYERAYRHEAAGAICASCPVKATCGADALFGGTAEGVRAGILFTEGRPDVSTPRPVRR